MSTLPFHRYAMAMRCPACGFALMTRATDTRLGRGESGRPPQVGDLTICAECQAVLIYELAPTHANGLKLVVPSEAERASWDEDTHAALRKAVELSRRFAHHSD
jgi:hypothetical protein